MNKEYNDDEVHKHFKNEADNHIFDSNVNDFRIVKETSHLLQIALPTIGTQFFGFLLFPQTASLVGRFFGKGYLAAFSLATLSGNMSCLSIIIGTLSASETLMPRSFGNKAYREVGILALRGFLFCILFLILPIFLLWTMLNSILDSFGQDKVAAEIASNWVKIYLFGVPSVVLFRVTQRFLTVQNVVTPCLYASSLGCLIIQPLLLRWFLQSFGFYGSAFAIIITQWSQSILCIIFVWWKGTYVKETLPELSWDLLKEVIKPTGIYDYGKLSIGGLFSMSEWWYWEVVCFFAGKFGIVSMCSHTVAYQIIPLCYMLPLGLSIGLSVRMGEVISNDVVKAKMLAALVMLYSIFFATIVCTILYHYQTFVVGVFTSDIEIVAGCNRIWSKVCIDVFFLYIYGINSGILRALGLQWYLATANIFILGCLTLPILVHVCFRTAEMHSQELADDSFYQLNLMWSIIPCSYFVLNIILFLCYITADWNAISNRIRAKEKQNSVISSNNIVKERGVDECTNLIAT